MGEDIPVLAFWLLPLAENDSWMTAILFAPAGVLGLIALILFFRRKFQSARARDAANAGEILLLLGSDQPMEGPGRPAPPPAQASARPSTGGAPPPSTRTTNPLRPRRGPLEDYVFKSDRKPAPSRPKPSPSTETSPLEAHTEPPPLTGGTSPRRRLMHLGIIAVAVIATTLFLVAIYPEKGDQPSTEGGALSVAGEEKGTNVVRDPLVGSITQALEYNLITSSSNPLMSPEERTELITRALQGLQDPSERQRATHQHEAMLTKMEQEGFVKEAWYAHIAACKEVCSPAFSALVGRHFAKVGEQTHLAVFFGLGEDSLDSTDRRDLRHMADLLSTTTYAGHRLLLIGRASKIGDHELNMALSERRVNTVRKALIKFGVSTDRIKSFWLGWEQPYLTREIANRLQISIDLYDNDEMKLNQSVMLVLY